MDILAHRVDVERAGIGIVVGVIDYAVGPRIVPYGVTGRTRGKGLSGATIFEIGSVTKVFTALLLADMVVRGEVRMDDPVATFLPSNVRVPERGGQRITLADLAAHTSGLPRDARYEPKDRANPYADFGAAQLYEFLSHHDLKADIGSGPAYSNLGMGLLGHVLSLRAGVDFAALLTDRITNPLAMPATTIAAPAHLEPFLAVGHDDRRRRTPTLDFQALAGAGALRSCADDLLAFLAAELGLTENPLALAMTHQLSTRVASGRRDSEAQALGWLISETDAGEVVWHVGRTPGFRCFVGFAPQARLGAVVLSNMATARAGEDIGFHLLTGRPIAPVVKRRVVRLSNRALDRLVGRYRLSAATEITVTNEGGRLVFDPPGPAYVFHASSSTDFFLRSFDVEVRFELGSDGRPSALMTYQDGRAQRAGRVEGPEAP